MFESSTTSPNSLNSTLSARVRQSAFQFLSGVLTYYFFFLFIIFSTCFKLSKYDFSTSLKVLALYFYIRSLLSFLPVLYLPCQHYPIVFVLQILEWYQAHEYNPPCTLVLFYGIYFSDVEIGRYQIIQHLKLFQIQIILAIIASFALVVNLKICCQQKVYRYLLAYK